MSDAEIREERLRRAAQRIRAKRRHMRESKEARRELEAGRAATHRRSSDEYVRPTHELRMSTWEEARAVSVYDDRGFDDRPLFWAGVRGTAYTDPRRFFHPPGRWVETWGELVPEPFNAHDEYAVAVDLDGVRVGYASARYARYAHGYVSALNNQGRRVVVPLKYRSVYARELRTLLAQAFVALPTFGEFAKYLPSDDEYEEVLKPLWEA